ncbi:MAG: hypothetical protein ACWA5X_01600 [bacterium]
MLKAGRFAAWAGVIITAIGLVGGFVLMMNGSLYAKTFLMMTPLGFLLLFSGVITAILFGEAVEPRRPE